MTTQLDTRPEATQVKEIQELMGRIEALEKRLPEERVTIGLLRGDLDYTMAAFNIALGAREEGLEVDLFFTLWAIAGLRDPKKRARKGLLDKVFGWMLPRGSKGLPLSKMQMMGVGPVMIRNVMKMRGAKSMEELLQEAAAKGVRIHICERSMKVMGIQRQELIDYPGLDFVDVDTFAQLMTKSRQCWFL